MAENLHEKFIDKLVEKYGVWEKVTSKFGSRSFGKIAEDLCISSSQFSKLISGTATEGMYVRSIRNVEQLIQFEVEKTEKERVQSENERLQKELEENTLKRGSPVKTVVVIALAAAIFSAILGMALARQFQAPPIDDIYQQEVAHFLGPFFDRDFKSDHISPFLSVNEAQNFCPCSAYEGIWELDKVYTIPMPTKKPGLYYVAKTSDVRMKCYRNVTPEEKGKVLLGFEEMKHELWIDTKQESLVPKYFNPELKNYTKAFYNIDFEGDASFKKLADITSFMFNTFEIKDDYIMRKGEPSGRYAENIDHTLANQYEIDVKDVLENIVGNLVSTVCEPAVNNYCNPNTLTENESTIKYDCNFTIKTENLGIGGSYPYSKGFRLVKQNYSDNLLCDCE